MEITCEEVRKYKSSEEFLKAYGKDVFGDNIDLDKEIEKLKIDKEKNILKEREYAEKKYAEINRLREYAKGGLLENEYAIYKNNEEKIRDSIRNYNKRINREIMAIEHIINSLQSKKENLLYIYKTFV